MDNWGDFKGCLNPSRGVLASIAKMGNMVKSYLYRWSE